jgi:DNA-binding NarL/FixJ family response regulator
MTTTRPAASRKKKSILIVDDHPMMRDGLRQIVSSAPELSVCGEAATAAQAMELVGKLKPDLVLADISLADKNGIELIKDIQALHPDVQTLVISMHDETLYVERVLRAGGRGYINKQEGGKRIMEAIRRVLDGQICVSEKMSAKILEIFSGKRAGSESSPVERLTDREFEIFQMIGRGVEPREIAEQLHLSVKTVEVHRANIKQKLELKNVPELIRFAVRWVESQKLS